MCDKGTDSGSKGTDNGDKGTDDGDKGTGDGDIRVPMTSVRDQTCIIPGGGCMCIGPPIIPGGIGIGGLRCNAVHCGCNIARASDDLLTHAWHIIGMCKCASA